MLAARVGRTALMLPVLLIGTAAGRPGVERYEFDTAHTQISFVARHLRVSNVRGKFNTFSGEILFDDQDITRSTANVTIEVASLDTDHTRRDTHLKSADFFDAEKYPSITFAGKRVEKSGDQLALIGDLTIRDVTKEVRIPFEMGGPQAEQGRKRIGVEGSLKVNRFDYGLKWNRLQEVFQVVGDTIRIELSVEAVTPRQ